MGSPWVDKYLGLLEVEAAAADLPTLERLTRAHLATVPFENVSSILRRGRTVSTSVDPLDPHLLLESWLERRGGGVCFEVTEMFGLLLRELGYHAYPVLSQISFPGSHQAVVVELPAMRYLVDVGNGAPFFEPIPLDRTVEVRRAGLAYRFRPDPTIADTWWQDRLLEDNWVPFARFDLWPALPLDRARALQDHHTRGNSWVVDELRMIHCSPNEVCVVREGQLTRFRANDKLVEPLADRAAYARVATEIFGLPRLPVSAALDVLEHVRQPASRH